MYKSKLKPLFDVLGKYERSKNVRKTNARIAYFENGEVLLSYNVIAVIHTYGNDPRYHWWFTKWTEYSRTTQKHVKEFCYYNAAQRRKGLKNGTFAYVEL